jgi:hypothetical protein
MATTLASHQKLLARFSGTKTVDVQDPFWCAAMPHCLAPHRHSGWYMVPRVMHAPRRLRWLG